MNYSSFPKKGDKAAYDEFYGRYWKMMFNEAYKRLRDIDQCKDIVQDVFIQIWMSEGKREIENLDAYLKQARRNQVIRAYHRDKSSSAFEFPVELLSALVPDAESVYFAKELKQFIVTWLEMQPEQRRKIFRMRYLEEHSTRRSAKCWGSRKRPFRKHYSMRWEI